MWKDNLWSALPAKRPPRTLLKSSSFPTPGCGWESRGAPGDFGFIHITFPYYDYGYPDYLLIYPHIFRCKEKTYALYL